MTTTSDVKRATVAELDGIVSGLGVQEVPVLRYVAQRLAEGQAAYGKLDLERDRRDFEQERAAELADAIVYTAMGELRRVLARGADVPAER